MITPNENFPKIHEYKDYDKYPFKTSKQKKGEIGTNGRFTAQDRHNVWTHNLKVIRNQIKRIVDHKGLFLGDKTILKNLKMKLQTMETIVSSKKFDQLKLNETTQKALNLAAHLNLKNENQACHQKEKLIESFKLLNRPLA